jgi:radical SAM protein with 4Fe4S-binding SPASM domain
MTEEKYEKLKLKDVCIFPNIYLDGGKTCDECSVKKFCNAKCKKVIIKLNPEEI